MHTRYSIKIFLKINVATLKLNYEKTTSKNYLKRIPNVMYLHVHKSSFHWNFFETVLLAEQETYCLKALKFTVYFRKFDQNF